jgi:GH25 family lysozyme M1 (1,4-beta-N-acetylmuramidase)
MGKYMKGIDVSHHQEPGKLDYSKLVDEGFEWLIARAAYGEKPDSTFHAHTENFFNQGGRVGAYTFFRQSQGYLEQYDTFSHALDKLHAFEPSDAPHIAPVVDLEWNEKFDGKVDPFHFNAKAFGLIEKLSVERGVKPIIYLSPGFFQTLGSPEWLLEYPWWVAHYTQRSEPWCPFKEWDMWQYTGSGNTSGYAGDLDLNRALRLPLADGSIWTADSAKAPKLEEPSPTVTIPGVTSDEERDSLLKIARGFKMVSSGLKELARK